MQSASDRSAEKTSSRFDGVSATQRAPACSFIVPSLATRNPSMGAVSLRPQLRAEVAFAGVGQDGKQAFAVPKLGRNHAAGVKNRSRRDSAKNPFLLRKTLRRSAGIVVRNRDKTIHYILVEDFRDKTGSDSLDFVRAGFAAGENR